MLIVLTDFSFRFSRLYLNRVARNQSINHCVVQSETLGGKLSRCRIEKKKEKEREHKPEGTRGCTRPEVFGKDAMKKGDRNHPNSMQHGNYRIENSVLNVKISTKIKQY